MIIGIGCDLVEITRIETSITQYGDRFLERCFTALERERSDATRVRAASYAKRFAAKEACVKALGTGMGEGIVWTDIGVVNDESGRPTLELTGAAAARLSLLLPALHRPVVHLTLTDEPPYAQAFVVIEALPL